MIALREQAHSNRPGPGFLLFHRMQPFIQADRGILAMVIYRGAWYVVRGSNYVGRCSWYVDRGTWFVDRSTLFVARCSWYVARITWIACRGSNYVVRESWYVDRTTNNEQARYRPVKHRSVSHNVLINSNRYLRRSGDPVAE
jgi:hypothetical protein